MSWRSLLSYCTAGQAVDVSLIALLALPDFLYISIEFEQKREKDSTTCSISDIFLSQYYFLFLYYLVKPFKYERMQPT